VKPVYGANGRIGLVVPANNSVIEPELWQALPQGCAAYATRIMARGDLTPAAVRRMERDVDAAMAAISATGVDVIAYCDMVTTFIMDPGWNEAAMQRFSAATGVPCISAWTALRDALARLGARRVAVGTPYPAAIHALVSPFFLRNGFEVKTHASLEILAMREVPTVGAERLAEFVRKLDPSGCDALVLLATDLPTFASIAALEDRYGIAVLTSNQTILWRALRELGAAVAVANLGKIFHEPK
jgi:maleate isomerase